MQASRGCRTVLAVATPLLTTTLLATSLTGCAPTAPAGATIRVDDAVVTATPVEFRVPTGTVTVALGTPVDHLDADDVLDVDQTDTDGVDAPDDARFVPVQVAFTTEGAPWGGLLATAGVAPTRISLVAGSGPPEDGVAVPDPYTVVMDGRGISGGGRTTTAVVVSERTAQDLRIRVEYDGAAQEAAPGATPSGDAAALGALDAPGSPRPCGAWTTDRPGWRATVTCRVTVSGWTPYWPGRGWEPADDPWLVVRIGEVALERVVDERGREVDLGDVRASGLLLGGLRDRTAVLGVRDVDPTGGGRPTSVPLGSVAVVDPVGGPTDTLTLTRDLRVPPVPAGLG